MRFDFFCKAALEFLLKTGRQPDILHCHDWSTAHVASAFWNDYQPFGLWKPKVRRGGGQLLLEWGCCARTPTPCTLTCCQALWEVRVLAPAAPLPPIHTYTPCI